MSTPIVALHPEMDVRTLFRYSERLGIHHFPLIDESGLRGVVCTCDVARARPEQTLVRFVHGPAVTVRPDASAFEAATLMRQHAVGSVIITDEDGVWGIVTRDDLAARIPRVMEDLRCAECSSREHLYPRANGKWLCVRCDPATGSA